VAGDRPGGQIAESPSEESYRKGIMIFISNLSTITIIINETFSLLLKYKMAFPTTLFNTVGRSLKMYL